MLWFLRREKGVLDELKYVVDFYGWYVNYDIIIPKKIVNLSF